MKTFYFILLCLLLGLVQCSHDRQRRGHDRGLDLGRHDFHPGHHGHHGPHWKPSLPRECYRRPRRDHHCRHGRRRHVWTYDSYWRRCKEIYGCFDRRDANVFRSRRRCLRRCSRRF